MTILSLRSCGHLSPLYVSRDLSCVPVPPTIADDQTHFTVTRMAPVVLTCHSTGSPAPAVSWSKAGTQLGARGSGYRVLPSGKLQQAAERRLHSGMEGSGQQERSKVYSSSCETREKTFAFSEPQHPFLCSVCCLRPIRGTLGILGKSGFSDERRKTCGSIGKASFSRWCWPSF